jgi:antitoxin HigA-1
MARMFKPPHPGLTLKDDVLPALGLTVTEAAQQLDVSRVALSRVLNGPLLFRLKWPCASRPG